MDKGGEMNTLICIFALLLILYTLSLGEEVNVRHAADFDEAERKYTLEYLDKLRSSLENDVEDKWVEMIKEFYELRQSAISFTLEHKITNEFIQLWCAYGETLKPDKKRSDRFIEFIRSNVKRKGDIIDIGIIISTKIAQLTQDTMNLKRDESFEFNLKFNSFAIDKLTEIKRIVQFVETET
jgi:hypothetical protein